ncbi:MAG TPA: nucleotide exchange factor GrpE [Solirubrobacteraceae bacterium]|jgi:molecular chaperone GrpE
MQNSRGADLGEQQARGAAETATEAQAEAPPGTPPPGRAGTPGAGQAGARAPGAGQAGARAPGAGQAGPPAPGGDGDGHDEPADELAQIEDRYRRALADLDNYRKRVPREIERRVGEAGEAMLRDWLDVVDSVERALQLEQQDSCREGLEAVMGQIDSVLARHGATRIGRPGEQFDPERHEAIAVRPDSDAPDLTVLDVQRSGFALADRVIRPAHVVVARADERSR